MNPIVADLLVATLIIYLVVMGIVALWHVETDSDLPDGFVSAVFWPLWFSRRVYRAFCAKWGQ